MRSIFIIMLLWLPFGSLQAATVDITLLGLNNDKGQIQLALYDRKREFQLEKGRPFAVQVFPAQAIKGEMRFRFDNLPPGRYALKIHHDEDGDEVFDMRGALPAEGYAFFNNLGRKGTPSFDDASVQLRLFDEKKQVTLKMIYF